MLCDFYVYKKPNINELYLHGTVVQFGGKPFMKGCLGLGVAVLQNADTEHMNCVLRHY